MWDNNPYRSPADARPGEYDHSLLWRIFRACLVLAAVFLLIDLLSAALYLRSCDPSRWCDALSDCLSADAMRFLSQLGGGAK